MILRSGRVLATVVAIVVGLFVLADVFVTAWGGGGGLAQAINGVGYFLVSWAAIITAFALFLGFANVVSVHWSRIRTQKPGAVYSIVLLISLFGTLALGIGGPLSANGQFIFNYILQPLEATLFALLALFIATAAFRAFRVRNMETFFFVLFALIVLLGQVPVSIYLWPEFPVIKDWILNVPTLAGVRGILLGVALGVIATGLRVLIGADRPYTD
ncbi:MAG: hypothetical protein DPW09_07685 [Anaerolineae bacterium]|nr:hypothetical protein [Anaerolineales bacterium]MCQ3973309.1 hypothetical protein [Anaerolineae bacterium]